MAAQKALIFVCSRTSQICEKRLSHRVAKYLAQMGIGEIGDIQALGTQLSLSREQRRKMIFVNDCNSSCVKMLTNGFEPDEYLYMDVSKDRYKNNFDIKQFCQEAFSHSAHKVFSFLSLSISD